MLKSAEDVRRGADTHARKMTTQLQELVRLAEVTDRSHEVETLHVQHLAEAIGESAHAIEQLLSHLKAATLSGNQAALQAQVSDVAAMYNATAQTHDSELAAIAAEVDDALREVEAHIESALPTGDSL
mmetsp:Transcript_20838/g.61650  ORF Transcript_20838/g.61650 Transcript_20838/m.61650 type:complete len:128 (+) Transcript_20838:3-386(+)